MSKFYIVKKDGKEIRCESASAAFEAWDCFGRHGTIVEMHIIDTDYAGIKYEYIDSYGKMARRKSKYGQTYFYFRNLLSSERKLFGSQIQFLHHGNL